MRNKEVFPRLVLFGMSENLQVVKQPVTAQYMTIKNGDHDTKNEIYTYVLAGKEFSYTEYSLIYSY